MSVENAVAMMQVITRTVGVERARQTLFLTLTGLGFPIETVEDELKAAFHEGGKMTPADATQAIHDATHLFAALCGDYIEPVPSNEWDDVRLMLQHWITVTDPDRADYFNLFKRVDRILNTRRIARIEQAVFGRWIVVKADAPQYAWSGSRWVEHDGGIGTKGVHVSNLATVDEAREYAKSHGLTVVTMM